MSRAVVIVLSVVFAGFALVGSAVPIGAQPIERPTNCTEVMSGANVFIGHDCADWASVLIVGRIVMQRPWSRTNRASRAVRIRERREGSPIVITEPSPPLTASAPANILDLDVSGGSSPDPDCGDFDSQAEAQEYFDANGWTAENDPFRLDQGGIPGVPCEDS